MKKLFILLLIPLLWSCQKYAQPSNPQLNLNGNWIISSYTLTLNSSVTEVLSIKDDGFLAVSPFQVISKSGSTWLIRNDTTGIRPCFFFKRGYQWEFDNNYLILKNDVGMILNQYRIYFDDPFYGTGFKLISMTTGETIPGHWDFTANGNGAMPASRFTIVVPEIWSDINDVGRSYNRALNQQIILTLSR